MDNLHDLFRPRAVAVVGASNTIGKIGRSVVDNIRQSGFAGNVFPVNPREREILGYHCHRKVSEIGRPVDVAVITVPASQVLQVARDCGTAGVRYLVVVTAGFRETGTAGLRLEKELLSVCLEYKMRMVGPNVVGILDMHAPLNASFAPGFPPRGGVAFISQSGALLLSIIDWSQSNGLGFSRFVSLGNKADLNESDFIRTAAEDPATGIILCYLEDIVDGKRFLQVAREASQRKPVIVLKAGNSRDGARAASSHTGALAGSGLAYDVALRQCGVVRAENMSDLFDLAVAFAGQPIPSGNHLAIITNAGGPGIIATDCVEANGLKMSRFSAGTVAALRGTLPTAANVYNPVDVLGDAGAGRYRSALQSVLEDNDTDCVLVLLAPAAVTEAMETSRAIANIRKTRNKPVFAVYMGGKGLAQGAGVLREAGLPVFAFPEPAVKALAGLVAYSAARRRLSKNEAAILPGSIPNRSVKSLFARVLQERRLVLLGSEAAGVAEAYGIPAVPVRLAKTAAEAVKTAGLLGYPVALKVASPKIQHKSDVGGVQLGLEKDEQVSAAFQKIMDNVGLMMPGTPIYGVEVQKMMPAGHEVIIGMVRDVKFGPLLAFGLGGIYVNLLKDASFRLAEGLTITQIREMIRETKAYQLLSGYRGGRPGDISALESFLTRVAQLSLEFPEITELDFNPVLAYPEGAAALDVKITISEDSPDTNCQGERC
jgi:acetyltransferase